MGKYNCDVIVIGAGISGLTAAHQLTKSGHSVMVLEADNRIGGRINSEPNEWFGRVEMGGMLLAPTQLNMLNYVKQCGLSTFNAPPAYSKKLDNVFLEAGKRIKYKGVIKPHASPQGKKLSMYKNGIALKRELLKWGEKLREGRNGFPADTPIAQQLNKVNAVEWVKMNDKSNQVIQFLRATSNECSPLSVQPSLLWEAWSEKVLGDELGSEELLVKGGTSSIIRCIAEGKDIRTREVVREIQQSKTGCRVRTNNSAYQCERVIVTIPQNKLKNVTFSPRLSPELTNYLDGMKMGKVIKCMITYPSRFWLSQGLAGHADEFARNGGQLQAYDVSPPRSSQGLMCVFISGDAAVEVSKKNTRRAVVTAATSFLERAFSIGFKDYLDFQYCDWAKEKYIGGCYNCVPDGEWGILDVDLGAPVGRIHWAGSEYSSKWFGYMEGAVISGKRAAKQVKAALE